MLTPHRRFAAGPFIQDRVHVDGKRMVARAIVVIDINMNDREVDKVNAHPVRVDDVGHGGVAAREDQHAIVPRFA